jgi:hypothetical protein
MPVLDRSRRMTRRMMLRMAAATPLIARAQDPQPKGDQPAAEPLPGPDPIPKVPLGPELKTTPVRRGATGPNVQLVDASPLPRDREGIWILDFAFKPVRLLTMEVRGRRRPIHYLYYRVINNTGEPRMFVPDFTIVTDSGRRYSETVLRDAIPLIRDREDPTVPLYGAVDVIGVIPPSGAKQGIDDAIFGAAVWDNVDPRADAFKVYVQGLSNGYRMVPSPDGGEPQIQHKTLRIDFYRPGDELDLNEREIRLADPPYEWVYW